MIKELIATENLEPHKEIIEKIMESNKRFFKTVEEQEACKQQQNLTYEK